jgi:hypothetical protein
LAYSYGIIELVGMLELKVTPKFEKVYFRVRQFPKMLELCEAFDDNLPPIIVFNLYDEDVIVSYDIFGQKQWLDVNIYPIFP